MKVKSDTTEVKDVSFHIIKPHILGLSVIHHTKSSKIFQTAKGCQSEGRGKKGFPLPTPRHGSVPYVSVPRWRQVSRYYEGRSQGIKRRFRKPEHTNELIKKDSNRYFVEKFRT